MKPFFAGAGGGVFFAGAPVFGWPGFMGALAVGAAALPSGFFHPSGAARGVLGLTTGAGVGACAVGSGANVGSWAGSGFSIGRTNATGSCTNSIGFNVGKSGTKG